MRLAQRPATFGGLLSRFVSQTRTNGLAPIYMAAAAPSPPLSLIFFLVGGGVGVLVFFSSYALDVFSEMPDRAMTLEFTQDKHDMRCPSHT